MAHVVHQGALGLLRFHTLLALLHPPTAATLGAQVQGQLLSEDREQTWSQSTNNGLIMGIMIDGHDS